MRTLLGAEGYAAVKELALARMLELIRTDLAELACISSAGIPSVNSPAMARSSAAWHAWKPSIICIAGWRAVVSRQTVR